LRPRTNHVRNLYRSFAHKTLNVLLILLVGFNGHLQPWVRANAGEVSEPSKNVPAVFVEPSYPAYSDVVYSPDFGIAYQGDQPEVPTKDPANLAFSLRADPSVVGVDGQVTIWVEVINGGPTPITGLVYADTLENGVEFVSSLDSNVVYSASSRIVNLELKELAAGQKFGFSYTIRVDLESTKREGEYLLRKAELRTEEYDEPLTASTVIWFGQTEKTADVEVNILTSEEWIEVGPVAIFASEGALAETSIIEVSEVEQKPSGPELQFEVILRDAPAIDSATDGARLEVGETLESAFSEPVFLEVDLSSVSDLSAIPAGQEPFVAIYDPDNEIWVKQPILEIDYEADTVTVEAKHFSTWGGGLGDSLPQNGANVLLFDQPYTSLFTGGAQYSIPIWTPPGRAGMAPSIALSYSSKTIDGVLGDVQAPWVGVGWNIDGIEIVRKITTSPAGYGYENDFALTFNGEQHNLIVDPENPNLYHTERASFLYIERHNLALGNSDGVANATKEWWEVVATDGTRYRLGWNDDSEQRTLMYGYKCTTGSPCTTPDSPYSALGYAGNATNLVASRWRIDLVMDRHGNTIEYSYAEEQPDLASQIPAFDRASYLEAIEFTGHVDIEDWPAAGSLDLQPGYSVEFITTTRTGDTQPLSFGIWDQWDSKQLAAIEILFGEILVREYELGYTTEAAPNANGTLTLTSLTVRGGGFSEEGLDIPLSVSRDGFSEEGVDVPLSEAATIEFDYDNFNNRADDGGAQNEWPYPRLVSINNGYEGQLNFTYGNDGRGSNSWLNYRIEQVQVRSYFNEAANESVLANLKDYAYGTPAYVDQPSAGLGALVGYPTTTEKIRNLSDSVDILQVVHTFGTAGLDVGRELTTEWREPGGNVLRKTRNTYVTDNSQAPFEGWNYRYLLQTEQFELVNSALSLIGKTVFQRNPGNGNLIAQSDYLGASLYRKQNYEYILNADPSVYLLDRVSRQTLRAANNSLMGDTRYVYDGGGTLSLGELTLTQSLTGAGNQSVDASYDYDRYGNLTRTDTYDGYGSAGSNPGEPDYTGSIVYDGTLHTFPIMTTNALEHTSETEYLFSLGVPIAVTDPNEWTSTTTYDGLGRVLTTTAPGFTQPNVTFDYPDVVSGEVAAPYSLSMQIRDALGPGLNEDGYTYRTVTGVYDGLSRMLSQSVGGITTVTQYNDQGLVSHQSLPYSGGSPQFTVNSYDLLGRLTQTAAPGDITSRIFYDGLTVTSVDPNGHAVARTNDGLGRMIAVREYSGQYPSTQLYTVTQYGYDINDRLVQVRDNADNLTTITYDWLGRKTSMTDPDMGPWTYAYDSRGNLVTQIDARQQSLGFEYDPLNRLIEKTNLNTSQSIASYIYDAGVIGFRTEMNDQSGKTEWAYPLEDYGRTVTETRELDGIEEPATFTTVSDWLGRVESITYPDGEVVSYSYDHMGRAIGLEGSQAGELAELAYNVLSQIESIDLGNHLTIENTYYSGSHRLLNRTADNGVDDLIDFNYEYDDGGNITSLIDNVLGESFKFEYDHLDRLISAEGAAESEFMAYRQTFDYDSLGNILQVSSFAPGLAGVGTYEENYEGLWFLGDWEFVADASASSGGLARTGQPGASVRFQFEGDEVSYIRRTGPGDGVVHILIDGVFIEQLDNSQGSTAYQQVYTHSGLGPGLHWIEVRIASGTINLDAFIVFAAVPTATPTPSETPSEAPSETPTATDTDDQGNLQGTPLAEGGILAALAYGNNIFSRLQATDTPTSPPTNTLTPSNTPTPTNTFTPSHTPTPSHTASNTPTPSKTPTASLTPSATAVPALLAHWQFNEGTGTEVADTSGATQDNGTLTAVTWSEDGLSGRSLYFNNSNSRVDVLGSSNDLKPTGAFTLSVWMYPQSVGTKNRTMMMKSSNQDYVLRLDVNGYIEFFMNDLTPKKINGPIPAINTWTHIAATYDDPADQIKLYVNGVLVASETFTGSVTHDNGNLRFGENLSALEEFHGRLDEIAIYNYALTGAEVSTLYGSINTPTPTPGTPTLTPTVSNTPTLTLTPSITPTPSVTPTAPPFSEWGTGWDGSVTVTGTKNLHVDTLIGGRSCADGGDAVSYSVISLTANSATLSNAPSTGCLSTGDEILLINMQGTATKVANVGNYEFLRVASISGTTVFFYTSKEGFYGNDAGYDNNIGIGDENQKVVLQRVPNYNSLTVTGTLTGSAWNGTKFGLLAFRVSETLSGSGSINANTLGYRKGENGHSGCCSQPQYARNGGRGEGIGNGWDNQLNTNLYGGGGGGSGNSGGDGGGGSYGTQGEGTGTGGNGSPGAVYGSPELYRIFLGSGGGGGDDCGSEHGTDGGTGGGALIAFAQTVSMTGSMLANGGNAAKGTGGGPPNSCVASMGGGGSGGSVYMKADTVSLNSISALGGAGAALDGGAGRIAIFYTTSYAVTSSNPAYYVSGVSTSTPTPTPGAVGDWGTGADGSLTVAGTFNVNTQNSTIGRNCTDGGDAVAYSVVELADSSAKLSGSVSTGCILVGDEVMLINLQGTATNYANTGNYEFFRVAAVADDVVVFTTQKTKLYGDNSGDSNIGTGTTNQRVMLMRVPNYNNVTINGTLTSSAWNGTRFGLTVFRVMGSLTGSGILKVDGGGYRGGAGGYYHSGLGQHTHGGQYGESYSGPSVASSSANGGGGSGGFAGPPFSGGGGGFGAAGTGGSGPNGAAYGDSQLSGLWLGSGGGGTEHYASPGSGGSGGSGGGIVAVYASSINFSGTISAKANNGTCASNHVAMRGGGGSGGSIRLEAGTMTLNAVTANGGVVCNGGYASGAVGRIAFYSQGSLSYGTVNPSPYIPGSTPTPTPSPTPTGTVTPTAPAGWMNAQYAYEGGLTQPLPHGVTSVERGEDTDGYVYDENGNMVERIEGEITWEQEFNAENRLASVSDGTDIWAFVYDGDGNRIKQINPDGSVSLFLGAGIYNVEDAADTAIVTKYYAVAGQRVAMAQGDDVSYLLTDHLGSVAAVTDDEGGLLSEQRYLPFGGARLDALAQTEFGYTGQRDLAAVGLMDYNARWYDAGLGRFTQPDNMVAWSNPVSLNRYSYVANNPVKYVDPTGFRQRSAACDGHQDVGCTKISGFQKLFDIELKGDWSNTDVMQIQKEIWILSRSLKTLLGDAANNISPVQIFKQIFGHVKIELLDDAGQYCQVTTTGFLCHGGMKNTLANAKNFGLVVHEMAHRLNNLLGRNPSNLLKITTINDENGNYVTGLRKGVYERTFSGYCSNAQPCVQHSEGFGCDPSYCDPASEDFADMIMNYAIDGFANNAAGRAREKWIKENMLGWLVTLLDSVGNAQ
jgi:RHS repeat-associated protein/uncharacterized repeat protein (TIGR01451 family)